MATSTRRNRVIGLLLVCALATTARAQSFNVDFSKLYGLPSNLYGGAAGQTGFWQNVDLLAAQPGLIDVNGVATSAQMSGWGFYSFAYNSTTTGDDERLLDDYLDSQSTLAFDGLAAGDYDVYTYAFEAGNPLYVNYVSVTGSPDPTQVVGGAQWSGVHLQGLTYARHRVCGLVAGHSISIDVTFGTAHSTCNGIQLVHHAPAPITCAPLGPTSGGCAPVISATSNPRVNHANSCVVDVAGVDGGRFGLLFYGVSGPTQIPWCGAGGGNSFLCVTPPLLRTAVQTSGGTAGQCDGAFTLDWNAYQLAHPGCLGQPWHVCDRAWLQAWFRDPNACRSTFLSPMLELVYRP